MKRVLLAGNAVSAAVLRQYLTSDDRYELVGLTVDDAFVDAGAAHGLERAVGFSALRDAFPTNDVSIIMASGYGDLNRTREAMFLRLKEMGYRIETYVHPDAQVHSDAPIGEGAIILPGAIIEPHGRIGANSVLWANAAISHHATLGDHCWAASGTVISGNAVVERNVFLGVNSTIVNARRVGEYAIIGAGALITKDVAPSTVHLARSAEQLRFSAQDYTRHFGV